VLAQAHRAAAQDDTTARRYGIVGRQLWQTSDWSKSACFQTWDH
jgi:hypothetical protein